MPAGGRLLETKAMTEKPSKRPEPANAWIVWCGRWGYEADTLALRRKRTGSRICPECRVVKVRLMPVDTRRKKAVVKS